jgi:hypothetical protein
MAPSQQARKPMTQYLRIDAYYRTRRVVRPADPVPGTPQ